MHIKMKKETWWGKEENRHAGSISRMTTQEMELAGR